MNKSEQLNMQIPELDKAMEKLRQMTLLDDFLFDVVTENLENCKIIIELSMGIRIRELRWREGQKVIHNLPGMRGIRMDFYVEDMDGNIFNVEMQKRNEGNIPKRMRFYQALLDAPLIQSGEKSFDNLNPTYIIIICDFDLYKQGLYRYTFENRCIERPDISMGDECTKIVLNTKGSNDNEVEKSLIEFLHYVANSSLSNLPDHCDERLKYLHNNLRQIKSDNQIGVNYMTVEERIRQIKEEGARRNIIEMVLKKMKRGKSLEVIADEVEETVEFVQPIFNMIQKQGVDCDVQTIYELVYEAEN